jgi:hypothetical protein
LWHRFDSILTSLELEGHLLANEDMAFNHTRMIHSQIANQLTGTQKPSNSNFSNVPSTFGLYYVIDMVIPSVALARGLCWNHRKNSNSNYNYNGPSKIEDYVVLLLHEW